MRTVGMVGAACALLLLAGCGTTPQSGNVIHNAANAAERANASSKNTTGNTTDTSIALTTVSAGTQKMLVVNQQAQAAITNHDEKKVKAATANLESLWSSFEDGVKPRFPQLYAEVESSLDPLTAGSKQSTPDYSVLGKLSQQLTHVLQQLQQKVDK